MAGALFGLYLLVGSLFALTGLRQFFMEPLATTSSNTIWFAIQVLPLLLPLPGAIRLRIRSLFFMTLSSLLYFVHGTMVAFDEAMRVFAAFEVVFALAMCALTSWMVRTLRESEAA